jgi:hypothetical protein
VIRNVKDRLAEIAPSLPARRFHRVGI